MSWGQCFDLVIGLVQASLGVFLSWKAFLVSLKDLPAEEQMNHKRIFALCCVLIVLLTGVQTYRNFTLDKTLDTIATCSAPR